MEHHTVDTQPPSSPTLRSRAIMIDSSSSSPSLRCFMASLLAEKGFPTTHGIGECSSPVPEMEEASSSSFNDTSSYASCPMLSAETTTTAGYTIKRSSLSRPSAQNQRRASASTVCSVGSAASSHCPTIDIVGMILEETESLLKDAPFDLNQDHPQCSNSSLPSLFLNMEDEQQDGDDDANNDSFVSMTPPRGLLQGPIKSSSFCSPPPTIKATMKARSASFTSPISVVCDNARLPISSSEHSRTKLDRYLLQQRRRISLSSSSDSEHSSHRWDSPKEDNSPPFNNGRGRNSPRAAQRKWIDEEDGDDSDTMCLPPPPPPSTRALAPGMISPSINRKTPTVYESFNEDLESSCDEFFSDDNTNHAYHRPTRRRSLSTSPKKAGGGKDQADQGESLVSMIQLLSVRAALSLTRPRDASTGSDGDEEKQEEDGIVGFSISDKDESSGPEHVLKVPKAA